MASCNTDQSAIQERSLHEYLQSNKTVKIYVGPVRKLWFLNEELLCDRVPFFNSAFKSGWKEGKSKVMELTDDDPDVFGHLVDWVYTKQLKCNICRPYDGWPRPAGSPPKPVDATHELQWLKLWILADKFNLFDLGQAALNQHKRCLSTLAISPEAVALVCDNTAEESAMRTHLVTNMLEAIFSTSPVDGLGLAAAANPSFNQQIMNEIQRHLQIPRKDGCDIYCCYFHPPGGVDWGGPTTGSW